MSAAKRGLSRLARVASLIDQLSQSLEGKAVSEAAAGAALDQLDDLIQCLALRAGPDAVLLCSSLQALQTILVQKRNMATAQDAARPKASRTQGAGSRTARSKAKAQADRSLARTLRRLGLIIGVAAAVSTPMAAAAHGATGSSSVISSMLLLSATVGGTVINPGTGNPETVVELLSDGAMAVTDAGNLILLKTAVNDTFSVLQDDGTTKTYKVTAITKNTDDRVVSVKIVEGTNPAVDQAVVTNRSTEIADGKATGLPGSSGGGAGSPFTFATGAGDSGQYTKSATGKSGGGGSAGGGVRICFGILGCITVGKSPSNGGAGAAGPAVDAVLTQASHGAITTVSDNLAGIFISSVGGDGGNGGSVVGVNLPGANGGASGAGGQVTLNSSVDVTTTGAKAAGIFAQSRSGRGGTGGTGYGASSGGLGGAPGGGGAVDVTNSGAISTRGKDSVGIVAQSLGGGAGGGGDSYGVVGDSGGSTVGGTGGSVKVTNNGSIYTEGSEAHGILAQSIGGSGGNAGSAGGIVALGSTGSAGGDGGVVEVVNNGSIETRGSRARGIFAQSVGGGGGSGGDSSGLVSIGGSGTAGGVSDGVSVVNTGSIITDKEFSQGIFAQSIGGGGGSGGDAGALIAIGGKAGNGNVGGAVTVSNSGVITTRGAMSSAIQAQSVGGGGGEGGSSGGGPLTIGGGGGTGGDAKTVTVNHSGDLRTGGNDSHGIFAQSVGGGGGNGGASTSISAFAGLAIGGKGDAGGNGGVVDVNLSQSAITVGGASVMVDPTITTTGDRSRGVFAQSVGGGGGNGGFAAQVAVGYSIGAGAAIGGDGSGGGDGGAVTVDGDVVIKTTGEGSQGFFAQSIGGGGGTGGGALSFNFAGGLASGAFSLALGGKGAGGGDGGDVTVNSGGSISTTKNFSTGFIAQSVGGGGGTGGFSVALAGSAAGLASASVGVGIGGSGGWGGDGKTVFADFDGAISTTGADAGGAVIQSLGGGGGVGGYNISGAITAAGGASLGASVGLGGSGGGGGDGGNVTGRIGGDVTTTSDRSGGVLIQSVGGGGGSGGFNISGALGGGGSVGLGVAIGLGGSGGDGGAGGVVHGRTDGVIRTGGIQSTGLLVQSVGGGGGSAGFNISGALGGGQTVGGALAIGLGGSGGGGGDGGYVEGRAQDWVITTGKQSAGVVVQSVGGGGGSGGFNIGGAIGLGQTVGGGIAVGLGGAGGLGGRGGEVDAFAKSISTGDAGSIGFLAQSIGGGGGSGGLNVSGAIGGSTATGAGVAIGLGGAGGGGGSGARVGATVVGQITTRGRDSAGIVAQSIGGGGGSGGFTVGGAIAAAASGATSISVGVGGAGGDGGDGGQVTLAVTGDSMTGGKSSDAIIAQSIGGGGGSGGFSLAGGMALSTMGAGSIGVGVGGSGGKGGVGGEVRLKINEGVAYPADDLLAALTLENESRGVVAQSIGGAGGSGGFNITGGISLAGQSSGNIGVGVGGSGGDGGKAGVVTAEITGDVITRGLNSAGVFVQSVGGGGGSGAFNITGGVSASAGSGNIMLGFGGVGGLGGDAGAVEGYVRGDVYTGKAGSGAITYQSLGGGGGTGGLNVTGAVILGAAGGSIGVGVGGFGGGGGNASTVTAGVFGDVEGHGDGSYGILFQSVGGGGGAGGLNVTGQLSATAGNGGSLGIGLGGFGGGGGYGATVTGVLTGDVFTTGKEAYGALLQSVGGAGGVGGVNVTSSVAFAGTGGAVSMNAGVGGFGGAGGAGGDVNGQVADRYLTTGDKSHGLFAQSVGGAGGVGGLNVSGGVAMSGAVGGTITVGIGGAGGDGGKAGEVKLDFTGRSDTGGKDANAITAQSVGGGGGAGGVSVGGGVSLGGSGAGNIGLMLGGMGGLGGDGGAVTLKVNSGLSDPKNDLVAATTQKEGSTAVVAQSVGGAGGSGGISVVGGLAIAKTGAGNLGVGIGGGGGSGGDGGAVIAQVTGDVSAKGLKSKGVFVQSVGGGGGDGGLNITGGVSATKDAGGNVLVGVGGFGGDGGMAGAVRGFVHGDVSTNGAEAGAVTFQSLGGGGGSGGVNITGGLSIGVGNGPTGVLGVGIGGFGGGGGGANIVDAAVIGNVSASGAESYGILLQSVGGGGGAGGVNITGGVSLAKSGNGVIGFGLGGFGGDGGDGASVSGWLDGDVRTNGLNAYGAVLQSVGGAGGLGAMNVTGSLSATFGSSVAGAIGLGIGGFGGGGGNAGDVRATVEGLYVTAGENADGVIAQSLGGGGGAGGLNVTGSIAAGGGTAGTVAIGLGGFGGDGGDSKNVELTRIGDTWTDGANAAGVTAQSIAGGGGSGAINVSAGISASTKSSTGGFALGIGGFGGDGGTAGDVVATVLGNVTAKGHGLVTIAASRTLKIVDDTDPTESVDVKIEALRTIENGSHGVIAQSLGGGGGEGGLNVSSGVAISQGGTGSARSATIGIGGFGGAGGDAGTVNLTVGSPTADRVQMVAVGDQRHAVVAQSIGGGGGAGGINISGGISLDGQLTVGVGGFGGAGGMGKDVRADVTANLYASGERSRGLLAQSVGGGGGSGGVNISGGFQLSSKATEPVVTVGLGGSGGAGNISGDVRAVQIGQVAVEGTAAVGVLVQSVAGGGGDGGFNISAAYGAAGGVSGRGFVVAAGIGGSGGTGADAGDAHLTSVGDIIVNGRLKVDPVAGADLLEATDYTGGATGVLVQSIGGGGGTGAFNFTGAVAKTGSPVALGVGGSGGSGGDGGAASLVRGYGVASNGAEIVQGGLVRTFGDYSDGVLVQSVGGGGGYGGFNTVIALSKGNPTNNTVSSILALGGGGAGAGSGGTTDVRHAGDIVTHGLHSNGLVAQSIGGGGGSANYNLGIGFQKQATSVNIAVGGATGAAGSGGDVTVNHKGLIYVQGDESLGLLAQSIGGGGGNAATSIVSGKKNREAISIGLGRQGGSGGAAGVVDVDVAGRVQTLGGRFSTAILAQSIGGGGGKSSATSIQAEQTTGTEEQPETTNISMSFGLEGGVGATGGAVNVVSSAEVYTRGSFSRGIHAQSVGGGGGAGGSASTSPGGTRSIGVAVGGTGGEGASSGAVSVETSGIIKTTGADSDGVLAQSIGGSGGLGGMVQSLAKITNTKTEKTSTTATINVGGSGGVGAVGGAVRVDNSGVIWTEGSGSFGVRAQSIGGGGGVGGIIIDAVIVFKGETESYGMNLGGSGGHGGSAGRVDVLNEGLIYTKGYEAAGIAASSIGGGGGDAGLIISNVMGFTGAKKLTRYAANFGGFGGVGGTGGDVEVINRASTASAAGADAGKIITGGRNAYGIMAQSIGGGGGNGSTIVSATTLSGSKDSSSGSLNLGGAGGSGNSGGDVHVDNAGLIDTTGDGAHGILAQSVGGGGGNGGLVLASNLLIGALKNTPMITVGGIGGDGGDGGDVVVDNSGRIVTRGVGANGIVAQSIGGGGGDAQFGIGLGGDYKTFALSSALSALVGTLAGGSGGEGGQVTVNHSGDITVLGRGAQAIRAESINGGGGSIRMDFSGLTGLPGLPLYDLTGTAEDLDIPFLGSIRLPGGPKFEGDNTTQQADPRIVAQAGGQAAKNSNAGRVHINSTGTLGAAGKGGVALFSQAVGGGGGTIDLHAVLGVALDPAFADLTLRPVMVIAGLGGVDGRNNHGGAIDGAHKGDIVTNGDSTGGVLIQSIGGGGGRANIDITAPVGALMGPVGVNLGGANGQDEGGGAVTRAQTGNVVTTGDGAMGVILQSIGGGGGAAGVMLQGAGSDGALVEIGLGSAGGSQLSSGVVDTTLVGQVATRGDHAVGVVIQSIGGGGGEVHVLGGGARDVTLGGKDGASGDGQAIRFTHTGEVITAGVGAHGVFLQSIGGGGGAVFGLGANPTVTARSDNSGDGGDIRFQSGGVYTSGAGAHGVIAQSLGGGGGWADGVFAGSAGGQGTGGAIDLTISGPVMTTGAGSTGVFAQSEGAKGAGDIRLLLKSAVRGGSGDGVAVEIVGGASNVVDTFGQTSAISGWAIRGGAGDDQVNNHGLMVGDIDLGSGDNGVLNASDGIYMALHSIDLRNPVASAGTYELSATQVGLDGQPTARALSLGTAASRGGVFTNAGDFRMGLSAWRTPIDLAAGAVFYDLDKDGPKETNLLLGARVITTLALDGDFVQTATGRMAFDVAFGPYGSDRVNATGAVTVAGKGDVTLTWLENLDPITLFATTAGVKDNGLQITDTLALDYSVRAAPTGLLLDLKTNFGADFLNTNGRALGAHLDSAVGLGSSSGIGRMLALVGNMREGEEGAYGTVFRTLSPEPFAAPFGGQLISAGGFAGQMFNCTSLGSELSDRCAWAVAQKTSHEVKGDAETMSVDSDGERLRMGFERAGRDGWSGAMAVGFERLRGLKVDGSRSWSDGQAVSLGAGLKRARGDGAQISASLSGGYQWLDTVRVADLFDVGRGQSKPESGYLHAAAGAAYMMRSGRLFAEPALNVSMTALYQRSFTETGLGGLGVRGASDTQVIGTANPQLTVGVLLKNAARSQAGVSFTVGGVFNSDDRISMPYRLIGANPASDPAIIGAAIDQQALKLGVDVRIIGDDRVSARLSYETLIGDKVDSRTGGLNVKVRF